MRMNCLAPLFTIALLCGCNSSTGALGDTPTVSGQIQGWTSGTGWSMQLDGTSQAMGPIDGAGNFSLALPSDATMVGPLGALDFSSLCPLPASEYPVRVTWAPSTVQSVAATFFATTTDSVGDVNDVVATLNATTPDNSYSLSVLYVYFDQAATATGTSPCGGVTATVDVSVSQGWNTLLFLSAPHMGSYATSAPPPSAAVWTAPVSEVGQ